MAKPLSNDEFAAQLLADLEAAEAARDAACQKLTKLAQESFDKAQATNQELLALVQSAPARG